jgi:FecR-like protein
MSREPSKPGAEPLSRQAWERIQLGVFERLDRGEHLRDPLPGPRARPALRIWAGALGIAAAALLLLWWRSDATPNALRAGQDVPSASQAAVRAAADEEVAGTAPALPTLSTPARIISKDGPTQTTWGDAVITLASHSEVQMSGSDGAGWLVRLEAGRIDCDVAPRLGRPAFVVEVAETRVTVVGTRFSVARTGEHVSVNVREGHVRVSSGAAEVLLGPGQRWPEPAEGSQLSAPAKEGARGGARRAVSPSPRAALDESAQRRFERAARLEASDPSASIAIYAELARHAGPWAANALYAQARLEMERGRPERARPLLQRYLRRHPEGLNVSDVRALSVQLPAK